jgi:calcineurin-like phosphoesterase family protein
MTYWIISDTHFNHTKLEEWGGRSGDWQEQLYLGIVAIPEGDTLIHLGDICIGNDIEIHDKLFHPDKPGIGLYETGAACHLKNILVRGNHDKKSINWYLEHGWDFVCDGLELLYHGHYLHLTHRPARPQGNTTWNIHGHTHGNLHRSEEYCDYYSPQYHIDVSPEVVGYKPIRLNTLLKGK